MTTPQINALALAFMHEFSLGAEKNTVETTQQGTIETLDARVQHAPCATEWTVAMTPWEHSADGEYTISFQSLLTALEEAAAHLKTCQAPARP